MSAWQSAFRGQICRGLHRRMEKNEFVSLDGLTPRNTRTGRPLYPLTGYLGTDCGRWLWILYVDGRRGNCCYLYRDTASGERSGCALVLVVLSQRHRLIALLSDA